MCAPARDIKIIPLHIVVRPLRKLQLVRHGNGSFVRRVAFVDDRFEPGADMAGKSTSNNCTVSVPWMDDVPCARRDDGRDRRSFPVSMSYDILAETGVAPTRGYYNIVAAGSSNSVDDIHRTCRSQIRECKSPLLKIINERRLMGRIRLKLMWSAALPKPSRHRGIIEMSYADSGERPHEVVTAGKRKHSFFITIRE